MTASLALAVRAGIALLVPLLAAMATARAETLVTALSSDKVAITSNFTGSQVVIFGTVERDAQTVSRAGAYELVVTLTGPTRTTIARRKERVAGLWINRESERLANVPSFLAIATSAPIGDVAGNPVRARQGLGFDMLPTRGVPDALPPIRNDFDAAFFRLMQKRGLFRMTEGSVTFLSPSLFKTPIDLPANVPIGWYRATVYLFSGGVLLSKSTDNFVINKTGFESAVTNLAHSDPMIYGLMTVLIACLTGWLAGVLFRRD